VKFIYDVLLFTLNGHHKFSLSLCSRLACLFKFIANVSLAFAFFHQLRNEFLVSLRHIFCAPLYALGSTWLDEQSSNSKMQLAKTIQLANKVINVRNSTYFLSFFLLCCKKKPTMECDSSEAAAADQTSVLI